MTLNYEPYLRRRFDLKTQNCWHMLRDAWLELTGRDLGDRTPEQITAKALAGRFATDVPEFFEIGRPASPCIVLMRRIGAVPHVGLYYRGSVLQMTARGASYIPLSRATAGFHDVGFYHDQGGVRHQSA